MGGKGITVSNGEIDISPNIRNLLGLDASGDPTAFTGFSGIVADINNASIYEAITILAQIIENSFVP